MKWADMLMITPLDANTMAKLAGGICDNLLVGFRYIFQSFNAKGLNSATASFMAPSIQLELPLLTFTYITQFWRELKVH